MRKLLINMFLFSHLTGISIIPTGFDTKSLLDLHNRCYSYGEIKEIHSDENYVFGLFNTFNMSKTFYFSDNGGQFEKALSFDVATEMSSCSALFW